MDGTKRTYIHQLMILSVVLVSLQAMLQSPDVEALTYGMDTSLGSVNASYYGEAGGDGDYLSRMLHGAGDVNGDGFDDLIISAIWNDEGGTRAGQVYLIFGRSTGWAMDNNVSSANASFLGEGSDDAGSVGHGLCGDGDVNGDGYDDFLIGMPQNDEHGTDSGQAYLILGRASGWSKDTDLSQANASFYGEYAGDWAGRYIGCGGDVNGDGLDDMLIASSQNDEGGQTAGQTYLILGRKAGWSRDTNISSAADASFLGETAQDGAGISVAIVPDVNGDGLDDILIGAPNNDYGGTLAGSAYLVLGRTSGWTMDMDLSNANASFYGEADYDYAGYMVSGTGDVNGDGYGDILIGAYGNDETFASAGQAYLVFGRASGWSTYQNLSSSNASFRGEGSNDLAGRGLAGAGDVDGDGLNDIIIGSPENSEVDTWSGQAYLILGRRSGWAMDRDLPTFSDASYLGEGYQDLAGRCVAGAGDLNGDGLDDIAISAHWNQEHDEYAGQAYIVFPDSNLVPSSVSAVHAYDRTYTELTRQALVGDKVHVQLNGTDADASRRNIALVDVTSNSSDPHGIRLRLLETGANTGIFRGNFTVMGRSNEGYGWINSSVGELVKVASVSDPAKNTTLYIGQMELMPRTDTTEALEDQPYSVPYWTVNGTATTWTFQSDASWLDLNTTTNTLEGTPDNSQVGDYNVTINVSNDWGVSDEHKFILTVQNVPPTILTEDVTGAIEEQPYHNDYDSDDDGQGTITWGLSTNASWLDMDEVTGNLSGTPQNEDRGPSWVNVTVDDGNGGLVWSNFTLTVMDINDPPVIDTEDVAVTYEDSPYEVDYNATDIDDPAGALTWSMDTNASWLSLDGASGIMNGTPDNDDVGIYHVNISVADGRGGRDFHVFTLTVLNVNDPPVFTSTPVLVATVEEEYSYQVNAVDEDVGDELVFSLVQGPAGMVINATSHLVTWTPTVDQVGTHGVTIHVTDNLAVVDQAFEVAVSTTPSNHLPKATLLSPDNDALLDVTNPVLSWSATDDDGDPLKFDLFLGLDMAKVDAWDTSVKRISKTALSEYHAPELEKGSTYHWTVLPYDGEGPGRCLSGTWSFTIAQDAVTNDPPVIVTAPVTTAKVGVLYKYDVDATDKDGDALTYSLTTNPAGMTIDATSGAISWTPKTTDVGTVDVIVTVTDGHVAVKQSFSIEVKDGSIVPNRPPVIDPIPLQMAKVGKVFMFTPMVSDPDPWDSTNLSFGLEGTPPAGLAIAPSTGRITWKPTTSQEGLHEITIYVTDGKDTVNMSFDIKVEKAITPGPNGNDDGGLSALLPWLLLMILLIIIAIVVFLWIARSRRKAEEERRMKAQKGRRRARRRPSEGPYPDEAPMLRAIPVAVEDAEVGGRARPGPVPSEGPRPKRKVGVVSRTITIGKRSYDKDDLLEALRALPHEMPFSLLLKPMDEAADELLRADYRMNEDGHILVDIAGEWHYGEPKHLSKYLTPYIEATSSPGPEDHDDGHAKERDEEGEEEEEEEGDEGEEEEEEEGDEGEEKEEEEEEEPHATLLSKDSDSDMEAEDAEADESEEGEEEAKGDAGESPEKEGTRKDGDDIDSILKDLQDL